MKAARHSSILDIIANYPIETQEDLANSLRDRGFDVTQATVSRDIKDLRLTKVPSGDGSYRYARPEKGETPLAGLFIRIFSESVISMESANNLIVIKTLSASAGAAAEAIDSLMWPEILGTIAGDNTVLVIVRDDGITPAVLFRFQEMLR